MKFITQADNDFVNENFSNLFPPSTSSACLVCFTHSMTLERELKLSPKFLGK